MKKTCTPCSLFLIVFLVASSFIPKLVFADGMMIAPDPYSDRWDYSDESNQQAFINYEGGLQKMIISVGLGGNNSSGTVWLFPVPAEPNKVAIDVIKSLPKFDGGEEISKLAQSNLDDATTFLMATQIYPIPIIVFDSMFKSSGVLLDGGSFDDNVGSLVPESDVLVYEHLEKEGITSEIITAKTANGLYEYLKSKGLKIENGSIPVLNNYIGKDYSFVASWISSPKNKITAQEINDPSIISEVSDNNKTNAVGQKGVFVTFPTKDMYFPLLPTSVYGSKTVPATIRIIEHVSPKVFQDIKSFTNTKYYIDNYVSFPEDLKTFYKGSESNIKYTKIEINAPSKFLTEDLWIEKQAPVKIYYSVFFAEHPVIIGIMLLILSSMLASFIAGMLVFKDLRNNPIKLGALGLSNLVTIIGVSMAIFLINTKNKNDAIMPLLSEIKRRGYFWKRRIISCLFFPCILLLVGGLFFSGSVQFLDFSELIAPVLIMYILPVAVFISSFVFKYILAEDVYLFEQLKSSGYSTWTFQPKDKMKFVFIPVFSIFFLIISWLLIRFFISTV